MAAVNLGLQLIGVRYIGVLLYFNHKNDVAIRIDMTDSFFVICYPLSTAKGCDLT